MNRLTRGGLLALALPTLYGAILLLVPTPGAAALLALRPGSIDHPLHLIGADFDQDGKPNIWTSEADVLASMANYLKASGWNDEGRWGREVHITPRVLSKIEKAVPMRSSGCGAIS